MVVEFVQGDAIVPFGDGVVFGFVGVVGYREGGLGKSAAGVRGGVSIFLWVGVRGERGERERGKDGMWG